MNSATFLRSRSITRRRFLAGGVAVGTLLVAACSQQAPPSPTSATAQAPAAPSQAPAAAPTATTASAPAAQPAATPTPQAQATGQPASAVSLNWWPGWPGPYMKTIADAFMKANPSIKVQPGLFYPEGEKLLAALAAQNAPDLVSDIPYYNFIERGLVLPVDDLIKSSKDISTTDGDIRKANWDAFLWKGKYYGVPAVDTAGRQAMGINVDLVKEAGLDPDKVPQTWDELFEWHTKITKFDSAGNLQVVGMDPLLSRAAAASNGDPWLWPEMWGFHYFDLQNWKYSIDRPETVEFLTTIQKFYDAVGVEKLAGLSKAMEKISYGAFGGGRQAVAITYPSGPGRMDKANPKQTYKWTWVPMPTSRKGITLQTSAGHAQVIMKGTKQIEAAFKLAVYMTQKEACDVLFNEVGWIGPRKSWQKTMNLSKFSEGAQQGIKFFANAFDEAKEVWVVDMDPEDQFVEDEFGRQTSAINNHSITPKDAAAQMQTKVTAQLQAHLSDFKTGQ